MKTDRDITDAILADAARAIALANTAAGLAKDAAEIAAKAAAAAALLASEAGEGGDNAARRPASTPSKALGRALAALGYGTQFCPDFEFGAQQNRIVDSPIDLSGTRARRELREQRAEPATNTATPRQIKFLHAIAREAGLSEEDLEGESQESFGCGVDALGRRDASALIERLQQRRSTLNLAS
ncbi:MAG TPA: hypothetical protein VFN57_17310 [Thermomicrobiaceae bacterium]|nr:hypothetical protein [Thermomicrobiaceae bacterium]